MKTTKPRHATAVSLKINKNSGNARIVYTYSTLKTFNKYSKTRNKE